LTGTKQENGGAAEFGLVIATPATLIGPSPSHPCRRATTSSPTPCARPESTWSQATPRVFFIQRFSDRLITLGSAACVIDKLLLLSLPHVLERGNFDEEISTLDQHSTMLVVDVEVGIGESLAVGILRWQTETQRE
jgi:hypothetical protein